MAQTAYEPKILGFLCNWCCYTAADSAGVARYQYPPNIRVIRVMCTGRIDPVFLIDGFLNGADGVFVGGCHLGECHYISGNYEAQFVVAFAHEILKELGINPERLRLEWASAAEGAYFVKVITEFTQWLKDVGRLGTSEKIAPEELKLKLKAAVMALEGSKLRMNFAKEAVKLKEKRERGEALEVAVSEGLKNTIKKEIAFYLSSLYLKQGPHSVSDLAQKLNFPEAEVEKFISALSKKGLITLQQQEPVPIYVAKS